jgi:hypothetical protein
LQRKEGRERGRKGGRERERKKNVSKILVRGESYKFVKRN